MTNREVWELAVTQGDRPLRLGYADPPYLGQGVKRYGPHHPDAAVWDSIEAHADLLADLDRTYDGWAYCLSSTTLAAILPIAPPCRIAAWTKPFAAFKSNVRIAYSWEPVLFKPGRDTTKLGAPVGRDSLAESITLRRGLPGAKPDRFNRWILDLLGWKDGDTVVDLFPGTDGMARQVAQTAIVP